MKKMPNGKPVTLDQLIKSGKVVTGRTYCAGYKHDIARQGCHRIVQRSRTAFGIRGQK